MTNKSMGPLLGPLLFPSLANPTLGWLLSKGSAALGCCLLAFSAHDRACRPLPPPSPLEQEQSRFETPSALLESGGPPLDVSPEDLFPERMNSDDHSAPLFGPAGREATAKNESIYPRVAARIAAHGS